MKGPSYLSLFIFLSTLSLSTSSDDDEPTTPRVACPPNPLTYTSTFNVKTVLFEACDLCNPCWTRDKLALLLARRSMQDLIPKKLPKNFPLLLKYMKASIQSMKSRASARTLNLMTIALYDAFGGYLHSIVIPLLNEAFYAGNVDYYTAAEFHKLLGDMMDYLNTNGATWANPCDMRRIPTKVTGLNVKLCKPREACACFSPQPEPTVCVHTTTPLPGAACMKKAPKIPIPFLDDNTLPNAIAIPLKERSLFSLMSECSINILPKYYLLAMRCLNTPNFTKDDVVLFNRHFHRWIVGAVVPHLHLTDRWFPGFGSVMRIIETMNQRGLASGELIKPGSKVMADRVPHALDFDVEQGHGGHHGQEDHNQEEESIHPKKPCKCHTSKSLGSFNCGPACILTIVLVGIMVLVCLLLLLVVLLVKAKKEKDDCKAKSMAALGVHDEEELINTLVSIYCDGKGNKQKSPKPKGKRKKAKKGSSCSDTD